VLKKIGKVLPRSLESADHIWVVRGGGTPLEYARGAGKNRGENTGWGYPSFMTGQPGILVEMTGVTQPISMKRVTHVMSVPHLEQNLPKWNQEGEELFG